MYHRYTTHLVLDAEFHQSPGVTACGPVLDPKPCDPFLILLMCHNCYFMAPPAAMLYPGLYGCTSPREPIVRHTKCFEGMGRRTPSGTLIALGKSARTIFAFLVLCTVDGRRDRGPGWSSRSAWVLTESLMWKMRNVKVAESARNWPLLAPYGR